ncbi:MAG TPA: hypothetical protein VD788_04550 [Candidatus Polarisedimenticolaceae bacterium]|nr:hypothetical protein [Candidatus Polarisedimenticolaceae bacterium]
MGSYELRPLAIFPALLLTAACTSGVESVVAKDATRARAIELLVGDAAMSGEVIEGLLGNPDARVALSAKIADDEAFAGALVDRVMQSDRGKAVVASRIGTDSATTRTLLGMLMATGAMGRIISQQQAECFDLGEQFALGNQRRTMVDLKRLGSVVDRWAREHGGAYPVCDPFSDVAGCLASSLPAGAFAELRLEDAWGRPFVYHSDPGGSSYALISYATDGRYDELGRVGPTSSYDADIVYSEGDFVQWPGTILKEQVR